MKKISLILALFVSSHLLAVETFTKEEKTECGRSLVESRMDKVLESQKKLALCSHFKQEVSRDWGVDLFALQALHDDVLVGDLSFEDWEAEKEKLIQKLMRLKDKQSEFQVFFQIYLKRIALLRRCSDHMLKDFPEKIYKKAMTDYREILSYEEKITDILERLTKGVGS